MGSRCSDCCSALRDVSVVTVSDCTFGIFVVLKFCRVRLFAKLVFPEQPIKKDSLGERSRVCRIAEADRLPKQDGLPPAGAGIWVLIFGNFPRSG